MRSARAVNTTNKFREILFAVPVRSLCFPFLGKRIGERSSALHQKARLEPRRRDAVELDRAAAGQRQQDIAVARRSAPG